MQVVDSPELHDIIELLAKSVHDIFVMYSDKLKGYMTFN